MYPRIGSSAFATGSLRDGLNIGRCFEDGLLTTNGVSHGIELACGALTSPGDSVWMESPSYFLAHKIFLDHGLRVEGVPIDAQGLDTEALARSYTSRIPTELTCL